jgi:haloacetate dehalogenase
VDHEGGERLRPLEKRHVSAGLIDGFERRQLPGAGIAVDALIGGSGPPLLLLHGAPQTRMCWKSVAPLLAERHTVVVPDLRGYGRSDKPQGGSDYWAYSKRTMAQDQVETMSALGFDVFDVAGHDRGGRVAYRLALDHPSRVRRLAVLDIIPTLDVWESFDRTAALKLWHWTFQALPEPLPERTIGASSDEFIGSLLRLHCASGFAFDPHSLDDYLSCMRDPASVHGMCEDYRSGWSVDYRLDRADRGVSKIAAPVLALWGQQTAASNSPLSKWAAWADDLRGEPLACGHFLPEEAPSQTAAALARFFG